MTDEIYGSAPIFIVDEQKRKEWEDMPAGIKEGIKKHLHQMCQKVGTDIAIQILCNVYNDLSNRMDKLEGME